MKRRFLYLASASLAFIAGCFEGPVSDYTGFAADTAEDGDGDGWYAFEDCDDGDAAINPVADEVCDDGVDNDCDGLIDLDDSEECG